MKNFTVSVAAALAMSTFAVAGGDIAPVEPMIEEVAPVADDSGFYIGGAYSKVNTSYDWSQAQYEVGLPPYYGGWNGNDELDSSAFMLQIGYQFNKYLAVEGRYWNNLTSSEGNERFFDSNYDGWENNWESMEAYGIYLKPMYPVTNAFTVYGLVGYGTVQAGDTSSYGGESWDDTIADESAFQWGVGASYALAENISLFVDYVQLLSDGDGHYNIEGNEGPDFTYGWETMNVDVSTINFGLTYKF